MIFKIFLFQDLKSDNDTDDEEHPRKLVPKWALGSKFRNDLMRQAYNPPDIDLIFHVQEACPDLSEIFTQRKQRFIKRTSSAFWGKAPMTHNLSGHEPPIIIGLRNPI